MIFHFLSIYLGQAVPLEPSLAIPPCHRHPQILLGKILAIL